MDVSNAVPNNRQSDTGLTCPLHLAIQPLVNRGCESLFRRHIEVSRSACAFMIHTLLQHSDLQSQH